MEPTWPRRALIAAVFLITVLAISAGVWRYEYVQGLGRLAAQGRADLALASDRLTGQLRRLQEMAVLLADHRDLQDLALGQDRGAVQELLLSAADKTAALDIMFVAPSGRVLASAHESLGKDVTQMAMFKRAMYGALGTDHMVIPSLNQRTYLLAAPSFTQHGQVIGALVVAVDIDRLEADWRGSNPAVLFIDAEGDVFISNRSELLFWNRPKGEPGLLPVVGPELPFSVKFTGGYEIWQLGWGPYLPERALHLARPLPVIGMTGEVLIDVAPAYWSATSLATAVAGFLLAFGAIMFLTMERRRALAQANAVLESRVVTRTAALSDTNEQLRQEVAERRSAEEALQRAQADLVQAGKLSALGQMSAGLSHELNQPLMAIQTFAENGAQYLERGDTKVAGANMARISDMADRMARIVKNLRAFARQENREITRVDIVAAIQSALELAQTKLQEGSITLDWTPPEHPIWVQGGEVRLAQVMVNLVSNAADAMVGREKRILRIKVSRESGACVRVEISDTGPGIDAPEKIFDPFYSTKEVGAAEGMGLGLSISYGLVQSFGGNIRGVNALAGGAVFSVELEPWQDEVAA
ncbi:MAG: ATP-binding protein [Paracoccaceae bacterium]